MRSIIFLGLFVVLIGVLFFSLFKSPIHSNFSEIRSQMKTAEIERKQKDFIERQLRRCRKNLFNEAVEFVDSLIPEINPKDELDSLQRRFRPKRELNFEKTNTDVSLKPLFTEIDSLD